MKSLLAVVVLISSLFSEYTVKNVSSGVRAKSSSSTILVRSGTVLKGNEIIILKKGASLTAVKNGKPITIMGPYTGNVNIYAKRFGTGKPIVMKALAKLLNKKKKTLIPTAVAGVRGSQSSSSQNDMLWADDEEMGSPAPSTDKDRSAGEAAAIFKLFDQGIFDKGFAKAKTYLKNSGQDELAAEVSFAMILAYHNIGSSDNVIKYATSHVAKYTKCTESCAIIGVQASITQGQTPDIFKKYITSDEGKGILDSLVQ